MCIRRQGEGGGSSGSSLSLCIRRKGVRSSQKSLSLCIHRKGWGVHHRDPLSVFT